MSAALKCESIRHAYGAGPEVLRGVDLNVEESEAVVLVGPSGSGKTTLLSIAGCLLTPSEGVLQVGGAVAQPNNLLEMRRERIGFVFQHAQLLPFLSVRENLEVVAANLGGRSKEATGRIPDLLDRLGMAEHEGKKASVLSGGQRQRVSVARALLGRPKLILADEPTAALGWDLGRVVLELLIGSCREEGCGLLVVTHDTRLLPDFDRVVGIEDGQLQEVKP
ncbi:ABC transporter ATP-binding protein [Akkermansiaceae bacterium]|nr:ABC transporter ATP-binding protein [Akkermansiaceae bacterium]